MVYCWNCGEKNRDDAKYCFSCGKPLKERDDAEGTEDEENTKQDPSHELDELILTGDDTENLDMLTPENLQRDMKTLEEYNRRILKTAGKFKRGRIREEDFSRMLEDLTGAISSELKALNDELVCISPAVMKVTVSCHGDDPIILDIKTSADEEKLQGYIRMLEAEKGDSKAMAETPEHGENDEKGKEFKPPADASWIELCPVCRRAGLEPYTEKKLMGLLTENGYRCTECGAVFAGKDDRYSLQRVGDENNATWRTYAHQALTGEEWTRIAHGGMSDALQREHDIKRWLDDAAAGRVNFREPESPVILKKNERAVLVLEGVSFWEPRAVRRTIGTYGGPTVRVSKNVSLRLGGLQARSESQEELKEIDRGVLVLTNRRMIFAGSKRTINIDLRKILSIDAYRDGIASRRENKQKTEYFLNTDTSGISITIDGRTYDVPVTGPLLKTVIEGMIRSLG